MRVIAINFDSRYSLETWRRFWKSTGAGDVVLAQDVNGATARLFELKALGTEILLDRQGLIAFRSNGPTGYAELRSAVESLL